MAKDPPEGAIGRGGNCLMVAVENLGGLVAGRAASEQSGVLDKGAVGCGVAGYEDVGVGPDVESDDGAVLGTEAAEDGFQLVGGGILGGLFDHHEDPR